MPPTGGIGPFSIISTAIPDVAPYSARARAGHAIFANYEQLLILSRTTMVDDLAPIPNRFCLRVVGDRWSADGPSHGRFVPEAVDVRPAAGSSESAAVRERRFASEMAFDVGTGPRASGA
jgi:hypothetical protein